MPFMAYFSHSPTTIVYGICYAQKDFVVLHMFPLVLSLSLVLQASDHISHSCYHFFLKDFWAPAILMARPWNRKFSFYWHFVISCSAHPYKEKNTFRNCIIAFLPFKNKRRDQTGPQNLQSFVRLQRSHTIFQSIKNSKCSNSCPLWFPVKND